MKSSFIDIQKLECEAQREVMNILTNMMGISEDDYADRVRKDPIFRAGTEV